MWSASSRARRAYPLVALALAGGCAPRARSDGGPTPSGPATVLADASLDAWRQVGNVRYYPRAYRDFVLDLDWRADAADADGGVLLRADSARANAGYQVQIRDTAAAGPYERYQRMTGAIDSVAAPTHPASRPAGQWNHYRIEAAGQRYRVWLNGELVNDFFGTRAREGLIGLESPPGAARVAYRNVRVTPLDAGAPERLGDALAATGSPAPVRVLVITATHGFRHTEAIDASKEVLPELARTTEFRFDITDSASAITAENLARYDVLFLNNATLRIAPASADSAAVAASRTRNVRAPLTFAQGEAIASFVRAGKGIVLAHSALDAGYGSESYRRMAGGGLFESHPWIKPVHVVIEDRKSAATAHLPSLAPELYVRDEIYILDQSPRATSHVLLSLDTKTVGPPNVPSGPQGFRPTPATFRPDHPLSWVRREGQGRVFATVLGHFGDVWHRPDYLQHLLQGLRVAAGRLPME
jgi:type 1 glutamine amidotransferase